jgi:hypothetical protein
MAKVFRNGKWETIEDIHTDFPIEEYKPTREEIIAEKQMQIESYKAQIAETDYKVIKCAEAQILGVEMPYNVAELHEQRQALRDKINKIEVELERM